MFDLENEVCSIYSSFEDIHKRIGHNYLWGITLMLRYLKFTKIDMNHTGWLEHTV